MFRSIMAGQACDGDLYRIVDSHQLSAEEVAGALIGQVIIAIGERHGVGAHPKAAACLLRNLSDRSDSIPVFATEHISVSDQEKVNAFRKGYPEAVSGLGKALRWWESGWPSWNIYEPLFQVAWSRRMSVVGADIPKPIVARPPRELEKKLGIEKVAFIRREWANIMREAHCDMLDDERASSLGDQQIARDAAMASVLEKVSKVGATVIFYAGRSHVRKDLAVPVHLAKGMSLRVLSISLQETHIAGKPVDRQKVMEEARGRYDYVWFVGEAKNDTLCEKLK